MKSKACTSCGIEKNFDEYDNDDKDMTGVMAVCKKCVAPPKPQSRRRGSKRVVKEPKQTVESDIDTRDVENPPYIPTVESA